MITMPPTVAEIRRDICMRKGCDQLPFNDFLDPCARCPNGHWSRYSRDCEKVAAPAMFPPRLVPSSAADHEKQAARAGRVSPCCSDESRTAM